MILSMQYCIESILMLQFITRKRQRKETKMDYSLDNLFVVFDKKKDYSQKCGFISRKPLDYNLESQYLCDKYKLSKPNNPHNIHYAGELSVVICASVSTFNRIADGYICQTIYCNDTAFNQIEKMTGVPADTIKFLYGYDKLYTTIDTYALMCDFIKCAYMLWNVLIKLTSIMEVTNAKDDSSYQNVIDGLVEKYDLRNMTKYNDLSMEERFSKYIRNLFLLIDEFIVRYVDVNSEDAYMKHLSYMSNYRDAELFAKNHDFISDWD